ncbi:lectin BRA-3-like [Physella acuta]|uniref:lectin BRA-3-like n=1 Tax=Physella acuta TaxID=109671 RepID=UPI0027DBA82C|nr:lectin BRA-3-like [Physella acuta]
MSPLNLTISNLTLTRCAAHCDRSAEACNSFTYNKQTQVCQLGAWAEQTPSPTSNADNKVYTAQAFCTTSANFTLASNGSVSTCLYLSQENLNYSDASLACKALGAQMYTIREMEKFHIIIKALSKSKENYWIGLSDVVSEGHYVWEDDGTEITSEMKSAIFASGMPYGYSFYDCIRYVYTWFMFGDHNCANMYKFVCEKTPTRHM